jgi:hypothetical protein
MFEFKYYTPSNWYLIVPEAIYVILLFGGALAALGSIVALIFCLFKKRRRCIIRWIVALLASLFLIFLLLIGIIIADTMIGGW